MAAMTSASFRVLIAFALGLIGGQVWVSVLHARHHPRDERRGVVVASRQGSSETRTGGDSHDPVTFESGGVSQAEPQRIPVGGFTSGTSNTASERIRPDGQPDDPLLQASNQVALEDGFVPPSGLALSAGGAGAAVLHQSEHLIAIPHAPMGTSPTLDEWLTQRREESLEGIEKHLGTLPQYGDPPWRDHAFQIVASLHPGFPVAVAGRDFAAWASPETSLAWYESRFNTSGDESKRKEALAVLSTWEMERRAMLGEILARMQQDLIPDSAYQRSDLIAYALVDRKLVLITRDEGKSLAPLLEEGAAMPEEFIDRARKILE